MLAARYCEAELALGLFDRFALGKPPRTTPATSTAICNMMWQNHTVIDY
jgi:hypothetical protein